MTRPLNVIGLLLVIAAAAGLFQLKHEVQQLEAELVALDRVLVEEYEALRVLQAEWSYLNRPERLTRLAAAHLELVPITASQIGRVHELPEPLGAAAAVVLASGDES